ncbi:MAG: cyclic nucleotide-binding domain-containing protein, partial [Planctomycetes bacterium]|nr:cyclic nucleotide-binding domain-containing protein [Planctomycetota bacterium]
MSVILAQESRVVRKYLRAGLGATRYAAAPVLEIESGSALLQSLKEGVETDTLILLDWNLPGLDVPILLDYLSRKGILDRVAILLCVNSAQAPAARETLRRGARGYLTRPFSDQELAAKIAEIRPPSGSGVLRDIVTTLQAKDELPSLLSLPPALQARLFEHGTRAHHEEGAILVSPGELVDSLSFVTRGEAEVLPFEGSGDGIVRGAGECFAERAFICGEPANRWVRALTAVDVVSVTKESVVELARGHAALQDFLTVLLTRRAGRAADEG